MTDGASPVLVDGFLFRSPGHLRLYRDAMTLLRTVDDLLGIMADATVDEALSLPSEKERRRLISEFERTARETREPYVSMISKILDLTIPFLDIPNVVELKVSSNIPAEAVPGHGGAEVINLADRMKNR